VTGPSTRTVRTSDGLDLAVYEQGDTAAPTVVLIHGYPDDHHVWDGVATLLADDFHVVRYDVRGCGASQAPSGRRGYAMSRLADDLRVVIELTGGGPAHLIAHDWGSIQTWAAVTDPQMRDLIASYTSISGPSLDMAAAWLRRIGEHPKDALRQLLASYYVFFFQLPVLPEATARSGMLDRLVDHSAHLGVPLEERRATRRPRKDLVNGIELYRANIMSRLARPKPTPTTVPVQVIAPTKDIHVSVPLQTQAPLPYCTDFGWRTVEGNHWVVEQDPETIATMAREHIAYAQGGPVPTGLTRV